MKIRRARLTVSMFPSIYSKSALVVHWICALIQCPQDFYVERIVHTIDPKGELISDSYVQPGPGLYDHKSAPGCPKSIDKYPWLYSRAHPTRCFLAGTRGPCDRCSVFSPSFGTVSAVGKCIPDPSCVNDDDLNYSRSVTKLGPTSCRKGWGYNHTVMMCLYRFKLAGIG